MMTELSQLVAGHLEVGCHWYYSSMKCNALFLNGQRKYPCHLLLSWQASQMLARAWVRDKARVQDIQVCEGCQRGFKKCGAIIDGDTERIRHYRCAFGIFSTAKTPAEA